MAGKVTSQGTGILLVTANVGSLFEDVSCSYGRSLSLSADPHARRVWRRSFRSVAWSWSSEPLGPTHADFPF
ncbi:hypothetical protein MHYP_G00036260 [Metynnis hypsauchen]